MDSYRYYRCGDRTGGFAVCSSIIDFNGSGSGGKDIDVDVTVPKVGAPLAPAPAAPGPATAANRLTGCLVATRLALEAIGCSTSLVRPGAGLVAAVRLLALGWSSLPRPVNKTSASRET